MSELHPLPTIGAGQPLKLVAVSLAATLVACHVSFGAVYADLSSLRWTTALLARVRLPPEFGAELYVSGAAAGAAGGLILGAMQLLLLGHLSVSRRRWLVVSALGGTLGGIACVLYAWSIFGPVLRLQAEWLQPALLWAPPGGIWAGVVGGLQLVVLWPRSQRTAWRAALLTMFVTGLIASVELAALIVNPVLQALSTIGW